MTQICEVLGLSRSAFYAWSSAGVTQCEEDREIAHCMRLLCVIVEDMAVDGWPLT